MAGPQISPAGARRLARLCLGLMGALMALFVMVGPSFGSAVVLAQATGSPSPTATGSGEPTIQLLNPSQDYDPAEEEEDRVDARVSDKFDGIDERYHVVAKVDNAPPNVVIELAIDARPESTPDCQIRFCNDPAEETIGLMEPVAGTPGLYEFFWDVPADFDEPDDVSDFYARLFEVSGETEQLAEDTVPVNVAVNEETAELTWPTQNGVLGFYKGRGGQWRTVIDASMSTATTQQIRFMYTTSDLSGDATYTTCATANFTRGTTATSRIFRSNCALAGKDLPAKVTAIAAVAFEDDNAQERCAPTGDCPPAAVTDELQTLETADVHQVRGFAQTISESTISLIPSVTPQQPGMGRALADDQCMSFVVRVRDQYDRPVQGANLDMHAEGPNDTMGFGADTSTAGGNAPNRSSNDKAPDKGAHNGEPSWDCDFTSTDDRGPRTQGDTNVPAGNDIKHIESIQGSGLSVGGSISFGEFRFHIRSQRVGFTDLTAWIDDEPLADPSANRDLDDDIQEPEEKFDTFRAQWYAVNPTIQFEPTGGTGIAGSCHKYVVRVRSASAAVPGINVDIHATGPNNDLDFCDPEDGSPRRAPDQPSPSPSPTNAHEPEDEGEATHPSSGANPKTQHTEGETDEAGNFVFGVTSPVAGDTTILGWIDREPGFDNDVQDASEQSATATQSWGATLADATIRFLNPSGYGSGADVISDKTDADDRYHLVARTDAAEGLPGVDFLISADGTTFTSLGSAARVGTTDTYELFWDSSTVPDGQYTLRVAIPGTDKKEDRTVTVNNVDTDPDPGPPPSEGDVAAASVELSKPANGVTISFNKGSTPITGVASGDATAVEVYYTKTAANTTRAASSWVLCGRDDLDTDDAPQPFSTNCALNASDQPSQVTGVAAIAIDCETPECGTAFDETYNSGDAHRVFGGEANPLVSIEPAEAEGNEGDCQRLILRVFDQTGQAIGQQNVDIHLTGPTDDARFCDPGDGSARSNPGDGTHATESSDTQTGVHQNTEEADTKHTEGSTNTSGRFIFGVTSTDEGDSQILGWVDTTENDQQDSGENSDTSILHWVGEEEPGGDQCTVRGTQGNDVLEGTSGNDIICGMGGNDIIRGLSGNDLIRAGLGRDVARGGAGDDAIRGRPGRDRLYGGKGTDTIQGGRGDDRIDGGRGQDGCVGGPGRDDVTRCE